MTISFTTIIFGTIHNEIANLNMKHFYDREQEMSQLQELQRQAYQDHTRFVVLTGRRRVGKTSLVYRFLQHNTATPGLYFFVGRKSESMLVESYVEEINRQLGEYIPESVRSFRELFRMLLEIAKRRAFTLFIDEFQEWDNVNPGVYSDIQELLDQYKRETHLCLIVSGSIFRLMEKIFKDENQPLFGRDDATIRLQPFTTETIKQILHDYKPDYSHDDLLALWTITGGVARYIELLMNNDCTTPEKMMHYICSNGDNFFVDEGRKILIQEFGKQYGTYFSILGQIARGQVTQSQIEGQLGIHGLSGQLKLLEEKYGIIRKRRPIGASTNSQTVRYEIADNFFRWWFRYMHRYSPLIELQNMPALEQIMLDDYTAFSGVALEHWFRTQMKESHRYQQIGGWWVAADSGTNHKGNPDEMEIDIVTVDLQGDVTAYEVKRNPAKYSASRLQEKVNQMQRHLYRNQSVRLIGLSMQDM